MIKNLPNGGWKIFLIERMKWSKLNQVKNQRDFKIKLNLNRIINLLLIYGMKILKWMKMIKNKDKKNKDRVKIIKIIVILITSKEQTLTVLI